ncbi:MAG: class I SAM-dependent methyltransferase [Lutibacter sp.]
MKKVIKNIIRKFPFVKDIYKQNEEFKKNSCFMPGHFYSTIVSIDEIKAKEDEVWKGILIDGIAEVNLNVQNQINLLSELSSYYNEIPFKGESQEHIRYSFENEMYSYTDGIILYSMMRHFKPKRIIEIGSGHSSAIMLDVNNIFFNDSITLTFIEPYTKRLFSLINDEDRKNTLIIEKKVQDVDLSYFKKLESGDILFIDSTHVSKCGSDLNFILFEILPILQQGVFIHFHDIFYPFEYPKAWVYRGFNWNENYILRAFLMNNSNYQIKIFSHYLHLFHKEVFNEMPLANKNFGGNLWLQKIK